MLKLRENSSYKWLICIAFVLIGYALILPPFEGFDENAHYSRVLDASRNMAGQFSKRHAIDSQVNNYPGPHAYGSGIPPFSTDKTYDKFYLGQSEYLSQIKNFKTRARLYLPSSKMNWQYQHPPLYYLFAGVINSFFSVDTLVLSVILLRIFSVALVLLGLIFCFKSLAILVTKATFGDPQIETVFGVFALCFPMFYLEFARIGNDALVFLCLSIAFYFCINAYYLSSPQRSLFWMSSFLALGLWTKALVLPMLPIFAIYSLYCLAKNNVQVSYSTVLKEFSLVFFLPIIFGLSWYLFSYFQFGDLGLGSESHDLVRSTGLIQGLKANFQIENLLRGLMVPLGTFIYAGSWSLMHAPMGMYVALTIIYCVLALSYVSSAIYSKNLILASSPFWLMASLYAGLIYHVLVSMALSGIATSGGWYFYVLTPWLLMGILISLGKISRPIVFFIQLIGLFISIGILFANILIFGGLVVKGDNKSMQYMGSAAGDDFLSAHLRLEYVSYPTIAYFFFLAALFLAIYGLYKTGKNLSFRGL